MRPLSLTLLGALVGCAPSASPDSIWAGKADGVGSGSLFSTGISHDCVFKDDCGDLMRFSPQYPLWTDGADKRRWVRLPSAIDTSDMDRWTFPVGTKFWKEFSYSGHKVETRMIEKTCEGSPEEGCWTFQSYRWADDQSDARLLGKDGAYNLSPTGLGSTHDAPATSECKGCHLRGGDPVLGFDVLQLSPDRDPNAPHTHPLPDRHITLKDLADGGLLSEPSPAWDSAWPRLPGDESARAAMGYLHGNCGSCHNPSTQYPPVSDYHLRYESAAATLEATPVFRTAVNHLTSVFNTAISPAQVDTSRLPPGTTYRIYGGSPERSAIAFRMGFRSDHTFRRLVKSGQIDPGQAASYPGGAPAYFRAKSQALGEVPDYQMPPVGTDSVDEEALALVTRFISALSPPP